MFLTTLGTMTFRKTTTGPLFTWPAAGALYFLSGLLQKQAAIKKEIGCYLRIVEKTQERGILIVYLMSVVPE